ncbi:MAG: hypothetical protein KDK70_08610 [Myxococcales bacterium]|nr:hypothetical protein [Myxococcales bacterium]
MVDSSSRDLHPAHGARFVLTRVGADEPPSYAVAIYLPQGQRLDTRLSWTDGQPALEPGLLDPWAEGETLKLARVLRRTPRASLTRWRGR